MSYDPCGTQTIDGKEILRRIADYLGLTVNQLEMALIKILAETLHG